MRIITIKQAVDMILATFSLFPSNTLEYNKSFYGESEQGIHFFFDYHQYPRDEVTEIISKMFSGITIDGAWLKIEPFTMGWTFVDIMLLPRHHRT